MTKISHKRYVKIPDSVNPEIFGHDQIYFNTFIKGKSLRVEWETATIVCVVDEMDEAYPVNKSALNLPSKTHLQHDVK